ncbi:Inositol oxygenase [Sarcoptes scabiei]|uniref:Inositol oxygenase n=1 Tax=Sarcoptes scabiei TaxID=52283 RepID=A0A834RI88_SARSC|nr:Inositol oxygenase [Sarcoptes scabiei]UXI15164.1 scavenger receptor class B member 1 [Sarcoptes scabiei]
MQIISSNNQQDVPNDRNVRKLSWRQNGSDQVFYIDPSEHFRPETKAIESYRNYSTNQENHIQKRVFETYRLMHKNQTIEFATNRFKYWTQFNKFQSGIMDSLLKLNDLIDESDPDVDVPNIVHAFQTAERIREAHPDLEWFHLTGLIHDLGKLMALHGEPQWAVVGDTYPLGCKIQSSVVYGDSTFDENLDMKNPLYNSQYGIYSRNCGLNNLVMSWGHDEYLYQVLNNHKDCKLPDKALYIIRFHSFYPWHTGGDYTHFCTEYDQSMLAWIREFNKFDLYSKTSDTPDIEEFIPYYQSLIDRYIPGLVHW